MTIQPLARYGALDGALRERLDHLSHTTSRDTTPKRRKLIRGLLKMMTERVWAAEASVANAHKRVSLDVDFRLNNWTCRSKEPI